jgi:hypothetical protein
MAAVVLAALAYAALSAAPALANDPTLTDPRAYTNVASIAQFTGTADSIGNNGPTITSYVQNRPAPTPDMNGVTALSGWAIGGATLTQQQLDSPVVTFTLLGPSTATVPVVSEIVLSGVVGNDGIWKATCPQDQHLEVCSAPKEGVYTVAIYQYRDGTVGTTAVSTNNSTYKFRVDRTPPTVTINAPLQPTGGYSAPPTVDVSVADDYFTDVDGNARQVLKQGDSACKVGLASDPTTMQPVTITFDQKDPSDPTAGVNKQHGTFIVDGPRDKLLKVACTGTDLAGNQTTTEKPLTISGGDKPPAVTITPDPAAPDGSNNWYKTGPTFTAAATSKNLDSLTCALNGAPVLLQNVQDQPGTGRTGTVAITQDGDNQSLVCTATDQAGRTTSTSPFTFKRDATPPATTDNVPQISPGGQVTLTATDATSQVAHTYYAKGTSPPDPTASSSVYDANAKPTLADGERIKYFSVDNAGNAEAVKQSVVVGGNPTPPNVQLTVSPAPDGNNGYYRTAVPTVNVAVTASSAVQSLSCTVDNQSVDAHPAGDNKSGSFSVSSEGNHTARCTATNAAGDGSASQPVNVDKTPPVTTDDIPASATGDSYTVTLTATDAVSQPDKTYYTTDGTAPTTGSPTYSASSKPVLRSGERIRYFSVDRAGNTETPAKQSAAIVLTPAQSGGGGNGGGGSGGSGGGGGDPRSAGQPGGGPQPPPSGGSGGGGSAQASATLPAQKLAQVLRTGFSVVVNASQASSVSVKLLVDRKTAKKLKLKSPVLGSTTANVRAGQGRITVPLSSAAKRALKKQRSIKATVEITIGQQKIVKSVTLKR